MWVLYMQPFSTPKNYTFCPGIVFLCIVFVLRKSCSYFPMQHRLIGVTETEYVYSAVGNEALNTIQPYQVLQGQWAYEITQIGYS